MHIVTTLIICSRTIHSIITRTQVAQDTHNSYFHPEPTRTRQSQQKENKEKITTTYSNLSQ